jgi:DNA modification methylase
MILIQGDCLIEMQNIPSGSVDLILTDPPYGTTACKWDSVIDFDLMWEQLNRIIKPNGAIVLFGSEPFSSYLRISNIKNYKYDWIWHKNRASNPMLAKKRPLKITENVIVFYKTLPTYNFQKTFVGIKDKRKTFSKNTIHKDVINSKFTIKCKKDDGTRYPKDILKIIQESNPIHPTQKPVALMEYLIKTYTNENETVLDFTMGSGTTGVACKNLNRDFIGIELDKEYFEIAKQRIENHVVQTELF